MIVQMLFNLSNQILAPFRHRQVIHAQVHRGTAKDSTFRIVILCHLLHQIMTFLVQSNRKRNILNLVSREITRPVVISGKSNCHSVISSHKKLAIVLVWLVGPAARFSKIEHTPKLEISRIRNTPVKELAKPALVITRFCSKVCPRASPLLFSDVTQIGFNLVKFIHNPDNRIFFLFNQPFFSYLIRS